MPRQAPRIEIPDTDLWTTLFDRKSKPFPDSQVIYQDPLTGRNYDYAKLKQTTILFGQSLQQKWSWKKGEVLAIFANNCIDTPAVTWGVHWAGGVVSPANPGYTRGEFMHHLKDSGAKGVVTLKKLLPVVIKACEEVGISKDRILLIGDEKQEGLLHLDGFLKAGKGEGKGERVKLDAKKDLAYLVYSSGTTGLPKGVMLSHGNSVANLFMVESSEGEILKWDRDSVVSVLPFYHIYGLQCLVHLPCYLGLTTLVMTSFDLPLFCSIIQDHKITYTYVAPPVILHLAKNPIVDKYKMGSLRMITSGAAPLTKELIWKVKERLGVEVKQAYGLSETSPVAFIQKHWQQGMGSNGPPLPNQTVKFVDPITGSEVPSGTEGELYISGPNIFLGYHNNASSTTSSMSPCGFFKTGDIGYEDAEGNMYITDRVKELIKYKGFQVAPAELEGVLMGCGLVRDVCVIGVWDGERESEVPLACVVVDEGVERNGEVGKKVEEWVKERLAAHKWLRGGVEFVDEVPKSASGKILRRVLKERFKDRGRVKAKL